MTTLYERLLRSTEEGKIPVWPLMNDLSLMMDGDRSLQDIQSFFNLTDTQKTELNQYIAAVQAKIVGGMSRTEAFHLLWHTLVGIEREVLTQDQVNSRLGV